MIELIDVTRIYSNQTGDFEALREVNLRVGAGEFVSVSGPSGSGKSTLMNLLGCLDRPTDGIYRLAGRAVNSLSRNEMARLRARMVGFIFQSFNLLPRMTALQNIELPMIYCGVPPERRRRRAMEILQMMGLAHRAHHRPDELSGGQRQRVAIGRALSNNPPLLLADEPTGNLDSATGEEIMRVIEGLHRQGTTIILITHEPSIARRAQRRLVMRDGALGEPSSREGGADHADRISGHPAHCRK